MAEQEIAKHTKNVIRLFNKGEHGWRHKLGEVALEIFTIVFAISLSIWLHGLGEHRHEQQQVRTFLLGLRHDIGTDIRLIKDLDSAYRGFDANFKYLSELDPKAAPDGEKFAAAYDGAMSNFFFSALTSRYQGFKSSGKLTNIENEALLEKILSLYERAADEIKWSEGGWRRRQELYLAYLENGIDSDDSLARRYQLVAAPKGKRLLRQQAATAQLYERYASYATLGREIIQEIEKAYPAETRDKP
jgi:hypothetical protein